MNILVISVFFLTSCVATLGNKIDLPEHTSYDNFDQDNKNLISVGEVYSKKTTVSWGNCEAAAEKAVEGLLRNAKTLGANSVHNIKFRVKDGSYSSLRPVCHRRFLIFIASTFVSGMAVQDKSKENESASIYLNPKKTINEIAKEYVAKLNLLDDENK